MGIVVKVLGKKFLFKCILASIIETIINLPWIILRLFLLGICGIIHYTCVLTDNLCDIIVFINILYTPFKKLHKELTNKISDYKEIKKSKRIFNKGMID